MSNEGGGFFDKVKDFIQGNPDHADKVDQGIDKVEGLINEHTDGQHSDKVAKGEEMLRDKLGVPGSGAAGAAGTETAGTETAGTETAGTYAAGGEPEATLPSPGPDPDTSPATTPQPMPTVEPTTTPEPMPAVEPTTTPEPMPAVEPTTTPEPIPTTTPGAVPDTGEANQI